MHRRHAAVRRRLGRHGGARRACDLRQRAAAPRRRGAVQSRRGAGPASQQYGDVHADLCRAAARHVDRLLRHQRALDRDRRHPDQLDRHLHGRAAAALDQAVVEGRADRGGLPHHREQHAHAARADGRHRGAARRLPARARSHRASSPTNTASRPSIARSSSFSTSRRRRRAPFIRAMPDGVYRDRDLSRQRPLRRRGAGADQGQGDRRGRRADGRLHRAGRASEGTDQFRLFRRRPDHRARRLQISHGRRRDGQRRHLPPDQADPAARQAVERRPERADVHVSDARSRP